MNGPRRRRKIIRATIIGLLLIAIGTTGIGVYRYNRPLPALTGNVGQLSVAAETVSLPWTASGESAIATADGKLLGHAEAANKVVPTASIAKLITVLTVLKKYPLSAGQSGPTITLGTADVDRMKYYKAIGGSTVPVAAGEQITEYQMIQAMLLPSANNAADSLAMWAFGSLPAYRTAAQDVVNHLGMGSTLVGSDASGFLADTTSTANDLVLLGRAALKESAITEIASQPLALIPYAGTIYTTNDDLGENGITGLKTGTTDQAGNCFLFSASHTFNNGQTETFVGVVMNSPTSQSRFTEAENLLTATYAGYRDVALAKANQSLGTIKSAWGETVTVVPKQDVSGFTWRGDTVAARTTLAIKGKTALPSGATVGTVTNDAASIPLVTIGEIKAPSFWWRILH